MDEITLTAGQLEEARGWFRDIGCAAPAGLEDITDKLDRLYDGGAAAFAADTKGL